jgi:hypothetical protein
MKEESDNVLDQGSARMKTMMYNLDERKKVIDKRILKALNDSLVNAVKFQDKNEVRKKLLKEEKKEFKKVFEEENNGEEEEESDNENENSETEGNDTSRDEFQKKEDVFGVFGDEKDDEDQNDVNKDELSNLLEKVKNLMSR